LLALLEEPVPFHSSELWMVGIWTPHEMARKIIAAAIAKHGWGQEALFWNGDIRIQAEFVSIILGVAV